MNKLVLQANELLKNGGFDYAFCGGQTKLDYIEFLFNDKSSDAFEYVLNREITLELSKAILFSDDIPYLAPEMILLYNSTDTDREGYQQDFELACKAMSNSQKLWLQNALKREYPEGHKWIDEGLL